MTKQEREKIKSDILMLASTGWVPITQCDCVVMRSYNTEDERANCDQCYGAGVKVVEVEND